jgi:hypothetical protein
MMFALQFISSRRKEVTFKDILFGAMPKHYSDMASSRTVTAS